MHELIRTEQYDAAFLKRYSNSGQLVCLDAGPEEGLFYLTRIPIQSMRIYRTINTFGMIALRVQDLALQRMFHQPCVVNSSWVQDHTKAKK